MKLGRNDPCHCGSGKKYKHCCYEKDHRPHEGRVAVALEPSPDAEETPADAHDEEAQQGAGKPRAKSHAEHEGERLRFRGAGKKGGSYNPRVFRGSQRGN